MQESSHKICSLTEATVHRASWKENNETVVFTNGCFDILHLGHVDYLEKAREAGTKMIVGVNADSSVRQLKGPSRPVNNESDRKVLLESLDFVDEVILFDEDTPLELIQRVQPNIITKGGDYTVDTVVGNQLAKVVILPTVDNYSTTKTIQRINNDTT